MAHADLKHYCSFGADIGNDVQAYSGGAAGVSITGGKIRIDNNASGTVPLAHCLFDVSGETYHFVLIELSHNGTLGASETQTIFELPMNAAPGPAKLQLVQSTDSTHFNLRITRGAVICAGTTDRATSTSHTVLWEMDGSNWRLHYWNGSSWDEECSGSNGGKMGTGGSSSRTRLLARGTDLSASQTVDLRAIAAGSDNRDAAPDGNMAFAESHPSGDGVFGTYGEQVDCTPGSTTATYDRWDDWSSGTSDGDTTHNCEASGDAGAYTSTYPSTTVPTGFFGLQVRALVRANATPKTVKTYLRLADSSSNVVDLENANLGLDSYVLRDGGFPTAADGSAWNQTEWNDAEVGAASDSGNGAAEFWTAMAAELVGVGNAALPPPIAAGFAHSQAVIVG